jgi:hypothetical protein
MNLPDKPVFHRELGVLIVTELLGAPDGQISEDVRAHVRQTEQDLATYTAVGLFDWCVALSKLPLTEISSFVRVLCDVEQFYTRPSNEAGERLSVGCEEGQ